MVITYGTRTLFKREGAWGHAICKNCGHDAPQTLCRQLDQVTLFFIPIVSLEKQRGILCESCGMIVPLDKAEYKRRREARQKLPFSELCTIKNRSFMTGFLQFMTIECTLCVHSIVYSFFIIHTSLTASAFKVS